MTIEAKDAHPGDVVFCQQDRQYYQAPEDSASGWSVMQPIGFMSGGPESTAPAGPLTLIGRGEKPACGHSR